MKPNGRGCGIRTHDLRVPNAARCRAAPIPAIALAYDLGRRNATMIILHARAIINTTKWGITVNRKISAIIIIAVLVIAGGVVYMLNNRAAAPSTNNTPSSNTKSATGTAFTINATDDSADITTLNVKKGDSISVTFNVSQQGVYHGGLEFKSDAISSGPIQPGQSKTITFTADKSFDFTPYWYQSNIKKDYIISVKVN